MEQGAGPQVAAQLALNYVAHSAVVREPDERGRVHEAGAAEGQSCAVATGRDPASQKAPQGDQLAEQSLAPASASCVPCDLPSSRSSPSCCKVPTLPDPPGVLCLPGPRGHLQSQLAVDAEAGTPGGEPELYQPLGAGQGRAKVPSEPGWGDSQGAPELCISNPPRVMLQPNIIMPTLSIRIPRAKVHIAN